MTDRRWVSHVSDVAVHGALANSVAQRALHSGMNKPHRPHRQAATSTPPFAQQLRVEAVEVFRLEFLQLDPPDVRRDVQADVALVDSGGRRRHSGSFPWEPPLKEIVSESDPLRRHVRAVVLAFDEIGEDPLGATARRTGGVPTTLGLASRRIDAVVDDGVVAVALLRDVAPHRTPAKTVVLAGTPRGHRQRRSDDQIRRSYRIRHPRRLEHAPSQSGHKHRQPCC